MSDYIEREAAIEACYSGYADCRADCADNIREIPAADVRPVVHGTWNVRYDNFMEHNYETCSNCGKEYFGACGFNFCPNCGADMRSTDNDVGSKKEGT